VLVKPKRQLWTITQWPQHASQSPSTHLESVPHSSDRHRYYFHYNHKNYNSLDCDCFKKPRFSTNSLAKLLLNSLLLDSLLLDSLLSDRALSQSLKGCSLNQPITIKVVIACVHAHVCFRGFFWRLIAGKRFDGIN